MWIKTWHAGSYWETNNPIVEWLNTLMTLQQGSHGHI